ncbi:hypothetical protein FSP39_025065 [Pinctada imbricata]|uniref:VWFA domain-containing protein n=1 Tax=Pinctada imbricata TaxID=66713 RepID=A0AA88YK58_PINIB|nr:hypothetical protein FSP39_025065 [Pinctada imbricata]
MSSEVEVARCDSSTELKRWVLHEGRRCLLFLGTWSHSHIGNSLLFMWWRFLFVDGASAFRGLVCVMSSYSEEVVLHHNCCKDKSDIVFLIDDSDSISRVQFEKVKYFIKRVLLPANIDSGNVRVGILLFNSDVRVEFDLNTYTSKRELFQHVDSIIPRIGGTDTAEALRVMNEEMFSQSKGDRNNVQNIAILVTDGRSRIVTETISRAKQARQNGVHIIVIGIGDVFDVEIREIASMPSIENAFVLEGFAHLRRFKDDFFKFCEGK